MMCFTIRYTKRCHDKFLFCMFPSTVLSLFFAMLFVFRVRPGSGGTRRRRGWPPFVCIWTTSVKELSSEACYLAGALHQTSRINASLRHRTAAHSHRFDSTDSLGQTSREQASRPLSVQLSHHMYSQMREHFLRTFDGLLPSREMGMHMVRYTSSFYRSLSVIRSTAT